MKSNMIRLLLVTASCALPWWPCHAAGVPPRPSEVSAQPGSRAHRSRHELPGTQVYQSADVMKGDLRVRRAVEALIQGSIANCEERYAAALNHLADGRFLECFTMLLNSGCAPHRALGSFRGEELLLVTGYLSVGASLEPTTDGLFWPSRPEPVVPTHKIGEKWADVSSVPPRSGGPGSRQYFHALRMMPTTPRELQSQAYLGSGYDAYYEAIGLLRAGTLRTSEELERHVLAAAETARGDLGEWPAPDFAARPPSRRSYQYPDEVESRSPHVGYALAGAAVAAYVEYTLTGEEWLRTHAESLMVTAEKQLRMRLESDDRVTGPISARTIIMGSRARQQHVPPVVVRTSTDSSLCWVLNLSPSPISDVEGEGTIYTSGGNIRVDTYTTDAHGGSAIFSGSSYGEGSSTEPFSVLARERLPGGAEALVEPTEDKHFVVPTRRNWTSFRVTGYTWYSDAGSPHTVTPSPEAEGGAGLGDMAVARVPMKESELVKKLEALRDADPDVGKWVADFGQPDRGVPVVYASFRPGIAPSEMRKVLRTAILEGQKYVQAGELQIVADVQGTKAMVGQYRAVAKKVIFKSLP